MYTKETLKKIADVLKLDVSVFEANLKSDKEETLEVPVLFTEDDKNSYGTNRFNEGKKAATEIAVKDMKEKHGLDFAGKSLDAALEAFAEKKLADAKIVPDEKVKKLETENKTLKTSLQEALGTGERYKLWISVCSSDNGRAGACRLLPTYHADCYPIDDVCLYHFTKGWKFIST